MAEGDGGYQKRSLVATIKSRRLGRVLLSSTQRWQRLGEFGPECDAAFVVRLEFFLVTKKS